MKVTNEERFELRALFFEAQGLTERLNGLVQQHQVTTREQKRASEALDACVLRLQTKYGMPEAKVDIDTGDWKTSEGSPVVDASPPTPSQQQIVDALQKGAKRMGRKKTTAIAPESQPAEPTKANGTTEAP